jgi:DDE domain
MRTRRRPRPAPAVRPAFAGFRFPSEIIVLAVRWYLHFGLSYRDVEELLTERGVEVDHVTIYRWVQRFTPLVADAARPCRHAVGDRWQVDETYVKVAGHWRYVYRAIDQFGQVIDVFVSPRRTQAPPGGSSSGPSAQRRSRPPRSPPTKRGCIRRCWMSCCQRHGTVPTATPTTASSATMVG